MIDRNKLVDLMDPLYYRTFTVFNKRFVTLSEGKYQDLLKIIRKTGETPVQGLERLIIEYEEGQKDPRKIDIFRNEESK